MTPLETITRRLAEIEARAKPINPQRMTEAERYVFDSDRLYDIRQDIPALVAALKVAVEAVEFYAERGNWVSRSGKMGICPIDTTDRETDITAKHPWAGGKKARHAVSAIAAALGGEVGK